MLAPTIVIAALVATSSATKLFVSSLLGNVTTLNFDEESKKLTKVQVSNDCGINPSWLQWDSPMKQFLYCVDENQTGPNGSVVALKVNHDSGALAKISNTTTTEAPVNAAVYINNDTRLIAVAHYTTMLKTWKLDAKSGALTPDQPFETFDWASEKHGPKPQQAKLHPHQVLIDPTNRYMVVPDLGGDQVRVLYIDPGTLRLSPRPSTPTTPGSGPRHGRFYTSPKNETFYYLVTEIGNTLTGYKVTYLPNNGGLSLIPIANSSVFGNPTNASFAGNAASEVDISKDGKNIIVSNRNSTVLSIDNPDPAAKNAPKIKSDTLARFPLSEDGTFRFGELSPAGGEFPRHFAESDDGKFLAVGLQHSGTVVIYDSCSNNTKLGDKVLASFGGLGNVTSIAWGS